MLFAVEEPFWSFGKSLNARPFDFLFDRFCPRSRPWLCYSARRYSKRNRWQSTKATGSVNRCCWQTIWSGFCLLRAVCWVWRLMGLLVCNLKLYLVVVSPRTWSTDIKSVVLDSWSRHTGAARRRRWLLQSSSFRFVTVRVKWIICVFLHTNT